METSPTGNEEGLIGYWNFNASSGNILYDHSGNGNHGTINGATWSTDVACSACGCTNPDACNYDPEAIEDDGSCATLDECGECGGDGIADGACDCAGNVVDCAGECGGSAVEDPCGICNGIATDESGCFIELSIGSVADGVMEIILNNTIPVSGFQFELTGVELGDAACSGGSAGDEVFQVSNNESGMVLGFSMTGGQLPQGEWCTDQCSLYCYW